MGADSARWVKSARSRAMPMLAEQGEPGQQIIAEQDFPVSPRS